VAYLLARRRNTPGFNAYGSSNPALSIMSRCSPSLCLSENDALDERSGRARGFPVETQGNDCTICGV
jgi:hypothetical protein